MSDTKVYSEYPVIVQYVGPKKPEGTSSMDGSTNPKQVLAFQKWVNKFKFKEKKIAEDGRWGPKTNAAWNQFGGDYMAGGAAVANVMNDFQNQYNQGGGSSNQDPAEKSSIFDKIGNLFTKAQGAKDKATSIAQQAKDLKSKVGLGTGSDAGSFESDAPSQDVNDGSKKKKIIILSLVGAALIGTVIYLATRKKAKA